MPTINDKLKTIEPLKIELNNKINELIKEFELKSKTKVLMFHPDTKPFKVALMIDIDDFLP
jgi:hypothetical protein|tara:strand:- start:3604 stop:3786 length:183 start_codon:yes stop_codon:yes gene_type:complete